MIGLPNSDKRTSPRRPPRRLSLLAGDRRGATAIEYGLILAIIVLTMMVALQGLASQTVSIWGNVNSKVANATGN